MSAYADYLKERTDDQIIETEGCFVTYRYLNEMQVYIVDVYVAPELREKGIGAKLGDSVAAIAKQRGCTEMLGTVSLDTKGSKRSIQFLWAYGMELQSANNNVLIFRKAL